VGFGGQFCSARFFTDVGENLTVVLVVIVGYYPTKLASSCQNRGSFLFLEEGWDGGGNGIIQNTKREKHHCTLVYLIRTHLGLLDRDNQDRVRNLLCPLAFKARTELRRGA
jgi:hypothetical protein